MVLNFSKEAQEHWSVVESICNIYIFKITSYIRLNRCSQNG